MIVQVTTFSQIVGGHIFDTVQIIEVRITFSQSNYWDSLMNNHTDKIYMKADVELKDFTGTYNFSNIGVRLKGNSSFLHPGNKKSIKIDFNRYIQEQNCKGLKKLNFNNCTFDPSFMREKLFFDMCHLLDIPAPRTNFANVYINDTLLGFYVVVEQVDAQFLEWQFDNSDGNLFKATNVYGGVGQGPSDLKYYGDEGPNYYNRYYLKTNHEENDWKDLIELIKFINIKSYEEFGRQLQYVLNLKTYLRSLAMDNIFVNLDSYNGSYRNYYLYHNSISNKWEWIKWDANMSFGLYLFVENIDNVLQYDFSRLPVDYTSVNRPLVENIFNDFELYNQYIDEVNYILNVLADTTSISKRLQGYKELISSSVKADTNKMFSYEMFEDNVFYNTKDTVRMHNDITGVFSFIKNRFDYLSNNVKKKQPPIVKIQSYQSENVRIFPVPADKYVYISVENFIFETLRVYNIHGQVVINSEEIAGNTQKLDVSGLEEGIYIFLFAGKGSTISRKVFIKH